jgi:glycopeptide antibiotics resistance protein
MGRWNAEIIIISFLSVLIFTLSPFNFTIKDGLSLQEFISNFGRSSEFNELFANVLLFVPLGFGLTGLVLKRARSLKLSILIALVLSTSLSTVVETIQVLLPSRTSSLTDICTNTVGGGLGGILYYLWSFKLRDFRSKITQPFKTYCSLQNLTVALAGYLLLCFLVAIAFQRTTHLSSWDPTFSLLLGNETTSDRPWKGHISDLSIANRAISKTEVEQLFSGLSNSSHTQQPLIASFHLTGNGAYPDRTHHISGLTWRGKHPSTLQDSSQGVFLDRNRWLETIAPAKDLTNKIRETSQFTLDTTVATSDITQTGPARIISLSKGSHERNFTLGQDASTLIFRLRTRLTGNNGTSPELRIPDIFTDTNPHRIVVTYDRQVIQFYVDRAQQVYSFEIGPGMIIARSLLMRFGEWNANLKTTNTQIYNFLYYGLILVPIGLFLALISFRIEKKYIFYALLTGVAMLAPAILLTVAANFGGGLRLDRQFYGIAVIVTSAITARVWAVHRYF